MPLDDIKAENLTDVTNLAGLTAEQITDIKRHIDGFAKKEQYFSKFVNHKKWNKGHKKMQYRRYVANEVAEGDIQEIVEEVAPTATSVTVKTYEVSVKRYGGKWRYTREDTLYGYDNIVAIGGDVLADEVTQTLDLLIGKAFFTGRATQTLVNASGSTPILDTLSRVAISFGRTNSTKPYANGKYLAIVTPEEMEKIRAEIASKHGEISEATKVELDNGIIGSYGRWMFSECPSNLAVKDNATHYVVCMGRSKDGSLPIDTFEMGGVEIINNPLGTGLLKDSKGNLTSDDNKQLGSIAWNLDCFGSNVYDDLALIRFEVPATVYDYPVKNDYTLRADGSEASNNVADKSSTSPVTE